MLSGTMGGDLLFRARAQCMDVNTRNYRWSESHSKVCQMYEDETVEHVLSPLARKRSPPIVPLNIHWGLFFLEPFERLLSIHIILPFIQSYLFHFSVNHNHFLYV